MQDFEFYNPARIIFGSNPYPRIEEILRDTKVTSLMMIHTNSAKRLGIYDEIKSLCDKLGISFTSNGDIESNPKIELVRNIIEDCRAHKVDFLLAAGGGSPIDTAKAVAMGACYDGDVWDFYDGTATPDEVLPIGVISTIPSSGSEASTASILSSGVIKAGYEDEKLIPQFAVLNPEYTIGLPAHLTACGISDILSHMLERYFTNTEHVDVTDNLIVDAAKALMKNAERVMRNPKDIDARSEIQWLATLAHNNLLETGRESDWASHRIEHELSGQYGINHGEGMAVILLAYLKYIAKHHPKKTAELAHQLFDISYEGHTEEEMTLMLAERLYDFYKMIGVRTTLSEMDIDDAHFEEMAMRATGGTSTVGHYYPLDKDKFIEVLKLAL